MKLILACFNFRNFPNTREMRLSLMLIGVIDKLTFLFVLRKYCCLLAVFLFLLVLVSIAWVSKILYEDKCKVSRSLCKLMSREV